MNKCPQVGDDQILIKVALCIKKKSAPVRVVLIMVLPVLDKKKSLSMQNELYMQKVPAGTKTL